MLSLFRLSRNLSTIVIMKTGTKADYDRRQASYRISRLQLTVRNRDSLKRKSMKNTKGMKNPGSETD